MHAGEAEEDDVWMDMGIVCQVSNGVTVGSHLRCPFSSRVRREKKFVKWLTRYQLLSIDVTTQGRSILL